jgi:hypothetical protein
MFRLLRVIISPSNEPIQDYLITSVLWDPIALTIDGVIVVWVHCSHTNYSVLVKYSGPSKVEHNPFQEAVRLSVCSTFELNGMSRMMLCNAALMVRLLNFYSSFKPNFSRIFCSSFKLFENQTVRLSRVHCIYDYLVATRLQLIWLQNYKILVAVHFVVYLSYYIAGNYDEG